ncbi:MmpS family transport accessory protein [Mycolicibacterium pulveris]|uniref:MmpS family transport accessory protein n=1 Tax=Mycolicibacterium pulveris TaxID=36813 RepID=UPI003CF1117C
MSGPNPPDNEGSDLEGQEPARAYSAPESEQFSSGPYVPADASLYDYDSYEQTEIVDPPPPPRWPWVVGVAAIIAAVALVASVSVLVTRTDTSNLATPAPSTTTTPPVQDEITTTTPPPPPTTTQAGPRQVTYSVTGTKAPGDIITVTYIDAAGRSRTQRNVYIPWSLTVTPISQSEVGSVQASSLFLVSRLNCSITTSDGTVLSSNTNNAAQTSC